MSYARYGQHDYRYIMDSEKDIPRLPQSQIGSTAYSIESGITYTCNSKGEWIAAAGSSGSNVEIDTAWDPTSANPVAAYVIAEQIKPFILVTLTPKGGMYTTNTEYEELKDCIINGGNTLLYDGASYFPLLAIDFDSNGTPCVRYGGRTAAANVYYEILEGSLEVYRTEY